MEDEFREIDGYPDYEINSDGVVRGGLRARVLTPSPNQQGLLSVALYGEGKQNRYLVSILVANAFLPEPEYDAFDTAIQLDGDRSNCNIDNLMWRPLWFARRYNYERRVEPFPNWTAPFELTQNGNVYYHPRDCAIEYGLLEHDINDSLFNSKQGRTKLVFPIWVGFRFI